MKLRRLLTLACFLGCVMPLLSGCLTVELVRWARDPLTPGDPVGVKRGQDADYVVYRFELEQGGTQRRAFRVPHDWKKLPRTLWPAGDGGQLTGLTFPIGCTTYKIPRGSIRDLRYLDHRLTLGPAVTKGGRHPFYGEAYWKDSGAFVGVQYDATEYALVRFVDRGPEGRSEIHELYAYDPAEYLWIRVGAVDIGRQRANIPARVTATVLFLPALVIDFVGMIVGAILSEGSDTEVGIPVGIFRRTPPAPVPFSARGISALDGGALRLQDPGHL